MSDPVPLVVRRVALELVAEVRKTRARLDAAGEHDALHDFRVAIRRLRSWVRTYRASLSDTLPRKLERRLRRIARTTGASRDLEVQLALVNAAAERARAPERPGIEWLAANLEARKVRADAELRRVLAKRFEGTVERLEAAFAYYIANVAEPAPAFGPVTATLVESHAAGLDECIRRVRSADDIDEAHQARIAAKRLRYLLEPLTAAIPAAGGIVRELRALQDALGDWHDAHIFADAIGDWIDNSAPDEALPGLRRLRGRLLRRGRSAQATFAARWRVARPNPA